MKKIEQVFTFSDVVVPIKTFPIFDITDQEADALRKVDVALVDKKSGDLPFVCNILNSLAEHYVIGGMVTYQLQQKIATALNGDCRTLTRYIAEEMSLDVSILYNEMTTVESLMLRRVWITLLLAHHSGIKV